MATVAYGTRSAAVGDTEHLGNISVDDIKSIYVRGLGEPFTEGKTLRGVLAREFWQLNSGEIVQWTGKHWRGSLRGKFGTLLVNLF